MKSRLFVPLALALGIAGAAAAQDQSHNDSTGETVQPSSAYAAETMEHLEAVAHPVPDLVTEENADTNKRLVEEQNREQYRQDMLREHNRRALMTSVHTSQQQQVKAFMAEGQQEQEQQQVVQEAAPPMSTDTLELPTKALESLENLDQPLPVSSGEEADRVLPAADVQVDEEPADKPEQEPS
ncbi:hypothetical protein [Microbulbifer sp. ALW1]|uniref:hypothetical protein n=1 Tax=Microbulbifer sp. (strain ALW1) TaxID=1516059 RepID=UPI0013578CEF|nr:hypothetical protein [Microbulbifer sp. ALW1]